MTNNMGNSESVMLKNLVKTKVIIAISLGAVLLPLSAIAASADDKETGKSTVEMTIEEVDNIPSSKSDKEVFYLDNESIKSKVSAPSDNATPPVTPSTNIAAANNQSSNINAANEGDNSNNDTSAINDNNVTDNKAASTTATYDSMNELDSANTEEKAVEQQPEIAKKIPFWQNTDYLLIGGLALLLLGGGLLLFRKISGLNAENQSLKQKQKMLSSNLAGTKKELAQANSKNERLEDDLKQQLAIHNEVNNSTSGAFGTALPVIDELIIEPEIEDLNPADLEQLSDSITTWFKTNRGNTEVRELVPNDIQHKLERLSYKIELWVGSDGVDSVELASDTKRAAVISLTKPDRQGFAYCYKKPNSLSNVWANKAWYQAQRTDRTLEVISKSLEIN